MGPVTLDSPVDQTHSHVVDRLLTQTRKHLQSTHIPSVLQAVTARAAKCITNQLSKNFGDKGALLEPGKTCAAGKLNGFFIDVGNSSLTCNNGQNEFIALFSSEPKVHQFCEGIYFKT